MRISKISAVLSGKERHDDDDPPIPTGTDAFWLINRWAEEAMRWMRFAGLLAVAVWLAPDAAHATQKAEYASHSPAMSQWFREAKPMPEAKKRLTLYYCCEQSDRYKTKFSVSKTDGEDEWSFLDKDGQWKVIPRDTIHTEGINPPPGYEHDKEFLQLENDGILFLYKGEVTCFWPPQSGN